MRRAGAEPKEQAAPTGLIVAGRPRNQLTLPQYPPRPVPGPGLCSHEQPQEAPAGVSEHEGEARGVVGKDVRASTPVTRDWTQTGTLLGMAVCCVRPRPRPPSFPFPFPLLIFLLSGVEASLTGRHAHLMPGSTCALGRSRQQRAGLPEQPLVCKDKPPGEEKCVRGTPHLPKDPAPDIGAPRFGIPLL